MPKQQFGGREKEIYKSEHLELQGFFTHGNQSKHTELQVTKSLNLQFYVTES